MSRKLMAIQADIDDCKRFLGVCNAAIDAAREAKMDAQKLIDLFTKELNAAIQEKIEEELNGIGA